MCNRECRSLLRKLSPREHACEIAFCTRLIYAIANVEVISECYITTRTSFVSRFVSFPLEICVLADE